MELNEELAYGNITFLEGISNEKFYKYFRCYLLIERKGFS